ncbi:MAG TPA: hypothetical protein VLL48_01095, partial [Longimicrobiales bacterium]|nr:hypothetical protein [Longimicrobiales bacterium]
FQRPEDERGAHLVVAWLLSPLAVMVALPQTDDLHSAAITDDGPLWAILVPSLAILAVGVVAWIRSHPHVPDEPDDPGAPPDADEP